MRKSKRTWLDPKRLAAVTSQEVLPLLVEAVERRLDFEAAVFALEKTLGVMISHEADLAIFDLAQAEEVKLAEAEQFLETVRQERKRFLPKSKQG